MISFYLAEAQQRDQYAMSDLSWDKYFMEIAQLAARKSHCYSRQIGAVIARGKVVISTGYNGPPMGVSHCEIRHPEGRGECPRRFFGYKSGEGLHMCPALHAEENAIIFAGRERASGGTIYIYDRQGILPCPKCAGRIINAGINEVVCLGSREYDESDGAIKSMDLFKEAGVVVRIFKGKDVQ